MDKEYPWPKEFQAKLLSLCIRKPEQVPDIQPSFFRLPRHVNIADWVSEVYKENPGTILTGTSLRELLRRKRGSKQNWPEYKDEVKALFPHAPATDDDFVAEQAVGFARERRWREALVEGEKDINAGHYDNALRRFEKLRQLSPQSKIFHTPEDFHNAPELSFAIEGFLQNDAATMIGGLSGHGKTWIMLSMVKALLTGKPLWGYFKVPQKSHHVIYLIPESSISPLKSRVLRMHLMRYIDNGCLKVHTLSAGPKPKLDNPALLAAAKRAHVFLDTAIRFGEGEENNASDNQKGLASDIFRLLCSGARSITGAHHSPKAFSNQNRMTLENVLAGSRDIGAMTATVWGVKQIDDQQNIVHIENVKPRDFDPCRPFQITGRPHIDQTGDFKMSKKPGACGSLAEEQPKSGASNAVREKKRENIDWVREWLGKDPELHSPEIVERFKKLGINVAKSTVRKYKQEIRKTED